MFWVVVLFLVSGFLGWAALIGMVLVQDCGASMKVMVASVICAFLSGGCALWAVHLFFLRIRL